MGDIATIAPKKAQLAVGASVSAMVPTSVEQTWRLSEIIAASGMAPKTYGTDPNKIMVGILAGMEVGLTPFAALQSIAVINGNPSLWGDGALALCLASNLIEDMTETDDGHTATCTIKRRDRTSAIVRTFSMDDAKKAGLAGKAGPWTQYTARMRQMRARGFALRDGFADVLKGLRVAEEVRDYEEASFAPARAQPAISLTGAALLAQAEPDAEPHDAETGELPPAPTASHSLDATPADQPSAEVGPADEPDARLDTLYTLKAHAADAPNVATLNAIWRDNADTINAMPDDMRVELKAAFGARKEELGA